MCRCTISSTTSPSPGRSRKRFCCCTATRRAAWPGTRGCRAWRGDSGSCGRTCAATARRPERVMTLTVIGSPPPLRKGAERIPALTEEFETQGVEHWARRTMAGRLGDRFPAAGVEWWITFMGRTPVSTLVGFNATINYSDIRADVPKIACPTLVITTDESGLASVEETRAWQRTIQNSELLVVPGNSYHVAASDAERCAQATLEFIARRGAS